MNGPEVGGVSQLLNDFRVFIVQVSRLTYRLFHKTYIILNTSFFNITTIK